MKYHKLITLRLSCGTRNPSVFFLFYLRFFGNAQALSRYNPGHHKTFKVTWLINHLNGRFLKYKKPEKYQSFDEDIVKYKGKNIMR